MFNQWNPIICNVKNHIFGEPVIVITLSQSTCMEDWLPEGKFPIVSQLLSQLLCQMLSQLLQYPNCYPNCYPNAIPLISHGSPNKFLVDPIENPLPGHHNATQAVFGLVTVEALEPLMECQESIP
jgi:hypothetical protein